MFGRGVNRCTPLIILMLIGVIATALMNRKCVKISVLIMGITLLNDGIFVLTEAFKNSINFSFSLSCYICRPETTFVASSFSSLIFETRLRMSKCSLCLKCWYLSHRRAENDQTSLRIRAVSSEPSLLSNIEYETME